MRQGEVFGLAVDDVDFDAGRLHIQRQVKLVRHRLVLGLPKNNRDRRVPLPASVADVLRQHMKDHPPLTVTLRGKTRPAQSRSPRTSS
ncbi:hypothetical protein ACFOW4_24815 [Micromonospora sp. GCM10011542]|uniref:hypothetical protein n=1 Tax=Micromonospora sp. GCM10011542 TaxID=3317337 RepID=UPI00361D6E74